MTLSVCIICKNEENNIERCLNSIKDIANEIIIVDTGSTDKTIEIIKKYNAKIIHHKWNNDFSEVRNISIKNANSDWILILDADEELDCENSSLLINVLNKYTYYEGLYLSLVNVVNNKESSRGLVFRVFKNNPLYYFKGKIHEQIIHSILEHNSEDKILDTHIKILHHGYDSENIDQSIKSKRNLEILCTYDEKDKDCYYYYVLGNEFIRINEFEKCIDCYEKSISTSNFPNYKPIYFPYLLFNIVKLLISKEQIEKAYTYFKDYISYYPDFKDFYLLGSICALQSKDYKTAKELMDNYNQINPLHNLYPSEDLNQTYNIKQITEFIDYANSKDEKNSMYYFNKGNEYFKNSDFINASTMYKKCYNIINDASYKPLLCIHLCISLVNINDYKAVIYYVDMITRQYKEFATLYIIKAFAQMRLGLDFLDSLNNYNIYKCSNNYPFVDLEYLFI